MLGAPLDKNFGTSISIVERVLKGSDPMLPRFGLPIVDVGDIAEMHVRALDKPETIGQRFIGAEGFMWMAEMAEAMKAEFPGRTIKTAVAPDLLLKFLSLFDSSIRTILPNLGIEPKISSKRARDVMGIAFKPARESVLDSARFLDANGLV